MSIFINKNLEFLVFLCHILILCLFWLCKTKGSILSFSVLWSGWWVLHSFNAISSLLLLCATSPFLHLWLSPPSHPCCHLDQGKCEGEMQADTSCLDSYGVFPQSAVVDTVKGPQWAIVKVFTKRTIWIRGQREPTAGGPRKAQRLRPSARPASCSTVCLREKAVTDAPRKNSKKTIKALW